jgi:hypothetical protein
MESANHQSFMLFAMGMVLIAMFKPLGKPRQA